MSQIRRRPSIERTISSQSLKPAAVSERKSDLNGDDGYSVGDDEFHIEYHNVPNRLVLYDSFHSLIQFEFVPLLFLIVALILAFVCIFALIYMGISDQCGLDIHNFNDAWLFALLVHFKSVLNPADEKSAFWNGCTDGMVSLFAQLFIGNILMSVLLSSLIFNFQSVSRRSKSLFSTLTMGQSVSVIVNESSNAAALSLPVVELNESDTRKVTNVVANVFVFDPNSISVKALASNVPLLVTLPTQIDVQLPTALYHSNTRASLPKLTDFTDFSCEICGKQYGQRDRLVAHLSATEDEDHAELLQDLSASITAEHQLGATEIVNRIRHRELEFIVIIEGTDPLTTDRIQIQKIFRKYNIVDRTGPCATSEKDGLAEIDYRSYL